MSVEQRHVVDAISTSKFGDRTTLTIFDHLPWLSDNKHLLTLQDKINDYLRFVQSGQLYESRPEAKGRTIAIQIVCKFQPVGEAIRFLEIARRTVESAGLSFLIKVLESTVATPDSISSDEKM